MTPLTILVVHQEPDSREALASALRQADHVALVAPGPAQAAAMLDSSVDAILLDLSSPGLDLAALRSVLAPAETGELGSLEEAERRHLALVLSHTGGNKRRAALILGISRSTLLNKVRKYHLDEPGLNRPSGRKRIDPGP